jgi:hypothetical protein
MAHVDNTATHPDALVTRSDAGSYLVDAACSDDTPMVQTLLSAPSAQSYINYTDVA